MKLFVIIFSLVLSQFAHAESVVIAKEDPLFEQYTRASGLAVEKAKKSSCQFGENSSRSWYVHRLIQSSNRVVITDGVQPLLKFYITDSTAIGFYDVQEVVVELTTSADYKQVVSVYVHGVHNYEETVNVGDLKNPKVENQKKVKIVGVCRI